MLARRSQRMRGAPWAPVGGAAATLAGCRIAGLPAASADRRDGGGGGRIPMHGHGRRTSPARRARGIQDSGRVAVAVGAW